MAELCNPAGNHDKSQLSDPSASIGAVQGQAIFVVTGQQARLAQGAREARRLRHAGHGTWQRGSPVADGLALGQPRG